MSASKQTAFDYIDEKSGVITDVSDKIWDYAELSLREYKSGELYAKVLKEEGFTVDSKVSNNTIKFKANINSDKLSDEQKQALNLNGDSMDSIKKDLEESGFTCK